MKKTLADLKNVEELQLKQLSQVQCQPVQQLKFLTEAWRQVVEYRRVLKWTHAYGYYLRMKRRRRSNSSNIRSVRLDPSRKGFITVPSGSWNRSSARSNHALNS
ncbi:hypothetical protein SLA2020_456800 [Shorea laevis]